MSYDDETVEELRDRLRERDLRVSGSKEELVARLQADDRDDDGERSSPTRRLGSLVGDLRNEFAEVTGHEVERITGFERHGDGWRARVDVVELSRVPRSTDVLGTYEVTTDADGHIVAFDRMHRYRRSEAGST